MRALAVLLVVLFDVVTSADAAMLCTRRRANGTVSGSVTIRQTSCTAREVQLYLVALGATGAARAEG